VAVTSIWRVKGKGGGSLKVVVDYAENPEKTTKPEYGKEQTSAAEPGKWISDVIHYAMQDVKTQAVFHDERAEIIRRFVTGVNCQPETARDEMMAVKRKYDKTDGVIAYHGYQSFAPGEATPETAHEIGVKLAHKLWGERYQVVVATHLDTGSRLHNHFVLNNVSMIDGKKYYRSARDYHNMARESDALCRAYSLSVIGEPGRGKTRHYAEWQAERSGQQTWRGMVKADVDAAIRQSVTERQFWGNLRQMGYEIKSGKDISVRPPGKERFVRLARNFGEDYAIEAIRRRILAQIRPERPVIPPDPPPKKVQFTGNIHTTRKITGLRALYFYYLYRMGVLPKKREPNPKRVYFLFREDIRYIQNISREARLLVKYGIDTADQLSSYKDGLQSQIHTIYETRKHLGNQARGFHDDDRLAAARAEIAALTEQLKELRREVKLCEDIETRSGEMRDKIRRASADEKSQRKELTMDEQLRGRR
jgi:hypothetical protein